MAQFSVIKKVLLYIEENLGDQINLENTAKRFHFSEYYFHRLFLLFVGKTFAAYIQDRRLYHACFMLMQTDRKIIDIAFEFGYNSAQSFSRCFKRSVGVSPTQFREQGVSPAELTVDQIITKFTNRIKGGLILKPKIIKQKALLIAGIAESGDKTWEAWNKLEQLGEKFPLTNKLDSNSYEIRTYEEQNSRVHVGSAVASHNVDPAYTLFSLPAPTYASFEIYVEAGYESENESMNQWLATNEEGYKEKLLGNAHYCVEFYDERFRGSESGSIVEIWIPVEKG